MRSLKFTPRPASPLLDFALVPRHSLSLQFLNAQLLILWNNIGVLNGGSCPLSEFGEKFRLKLGFGSEFISKKKSASKESVDLWRSDPALIVRVMEVFAPCLVFGLTYHHYSFRTLISMGLRLRIMCIASIRYAIPYLHKLKQYYYEVHPLHQNIHLLIILPKTVSASIKSKEQVYAEILTASQLLRGLDVRMVMVPDQIQSQMVNEGQSEWDVETVIVKGKSKFQESDLLFVSTLQVQTQLQIALLTQATLEGTHSQSLKLYQQKRVLFHFIADLHAQASVRMFGQTYVIHPGQLCKGRLCLVNLHRRKNWRVESLALLDLNSFI